MRGGEKSRQKESECLAWLPKTLRCPKCFILLIKANHFFLLVSFLFILLFKCYEVKGDDRGTKGNGSQFRPFVIWGTPYANLTVTVRAEFTTSPQLSHLMAHLFFMIYKNLGTFPYCCHYYLLASSLRESLKFYIFYSLCHSRSTASFFFFFWNIYCTPLKSWKYPSRDRDTWYLSFAHVYNIPVYMSL